MAANRDDIKRPERQRTLFEQYVEHGWQLCHIRAGEKRPRGSGWNKLENAISDPKRAEHLDNAGLLLSFSGAASIDLDHIDLARVWFREHDIDLDEIMNAPDAVQIVSGDSGRGKLIYALPVEADMSLEDHAKHWPTKQVHNDDKSLMLFELRCGATTGNSVQDVLPPSTNPRTGVKYEWRYNSEAGHWSRLPPLPEKLRELWMSMTRPAERDPDAPRVEPSADFPELTKLLENRSSDCSYDEWLKVGMILHHEVSGDEAGLQLWDQWSAKAEGRYAGYEDCAQHWNSFGHAPNPATVGSLRRDQVASKEDFDDVPVTAGDMSFGDDKEAANKRREELIAQFEWRTPDWITSQPDPVWLVDELIPQSKDIVFFAGVPGVGKSFCALDVALAIVRGVPWFGADTEQGAVGYIAAEAFGTFQTRLRGYQQEHEIALDDIADFRLLGAGIDLGDKQQMQALAESAIAFRPRLMIVDTLAAAAGGVDHNSSEMQKIIDGCKTLHAVTGATILVVAHVGKDASKGIMGWQGLTAAAETICAITKDDDEQMQTRYFKVVKQRNGIEGVSYRWMLEPLVIGRNAKGRDIASAVVRYLGVGLPAKKSKTRLGKNERAAFDVLIEHDGELTFDEVKARVVPLLGEPPPQPAEGEKRKKDKRVDRARDALNSLLHEKGLIEERDGRLHIAHGGTPAAPDARRDNVMRMLADDPQPGPEDDADLL